MKKTYFLRCFPDTQKKVYQIKYLTEKMTAVAPLTHIRVVVEWYSRV